MTFTEEELKAACEIAANRTVERIAVLAEKCAGLMSGNGGAGLRAFAAVLRDDLGLNKPDEAA